MNRPPFADRIKDLRQHISATLLLHLPPEQQHPAELHQAMRYACEGGKRLRALICYAAAETLQIDARQIDAAACAVELIHAYSLIHDDLPCMDDDALRRGKPSVHAKFGEATAVLAGDALQTLAFKVLSEDMTLSCDARLAMISQLALAAGSRGMVGGQAIDLHSEGKSLNLAELEALHVHKTGALLRACLLLACAAGSRIEASRSNALDRFGKCIGLAYQIQDDVLDVESSSSALGKTAGKDEARHKSTYPAVMGMRAAKERAMDLFASARLALGIFGEDAAPLLWLADHIEGREH